MKKSLIAFSVMALLVAGFAGASADVYYTDDLANYETGYQSENSNDLKEDKSIEVEVENNAQISVNATNSANSGNNEVRKNLGSTAIATGNATALQILSAKANFNDIEVLDACDCGADYSYLGNKATGDESVNQNKADFEKDIDVTKTEEADIEFDVENDARTGDNVVEENGSYETWSKWARATLDEEWDDVYNSHGDGFHKTWAESEESEESSTPVGGDVAIVTGNAEAAQDVAVFANENIIRVLRSPFGL